DKIYVSPAETDAGRVEAEREYTVVVWNAYLQDVDVEAHAWSGDNTGISVSAAGTPTFQLLALDEEEYDFTVSPEGPAFIDVSYVITIDSVDYEIAFTGARLVVLPFIQSGDVDE